MTPVKILVRKVPWEKIGRRIKIAPIFVEGVIEIPTCAFTESAFKAF